MQDAWVGTISAEDGHIPIGLNHIEVVLIPCHDLGIQKRHYPSCAKLLGGELIEGSETDYDRQLDVSQIQISKLFPMRDKSRLTDSLKMGLRKAKIPTGVYRLEEKQ